MFHTIWLVGSILTAWCGYHSQLQVIHHTVHNL